MTDALKTTCKLLPLAAALALAACGGEEAEPTYETDVVDESGGELIVADPDAPGIEDQQLPETEMTNVPADEAGAAADAPTPAADPDR